MFSSCSFFRSFIAHHSMHLSKAPATWRHTWWCWRELVGLKSNRRNDSAEFACAFWAAMGPGCVKTHTSEPLAKLPTEYGPRNLFARDRVVLGSLWWLSLPIWSIFPGATRIDPAAVAASV